MGGERLFLSPFLPRYGNFIGGKWTAPGRRRLFRQRHAITGAKFCEGAQSSAADVEFAPDAALDAALDAKDAWGGASTMDRGNIILKIADRFEQNLDLLARPEAWDNGRPIRETIGADIPLAIGQFRDFTGILRDRAGSMSEIDADTIASPFHGPFGSSARSLRGPSRS